MRETRLAVKITQFEFFRHVDMSVLGLGLVSALGMIRHESARTKGLRHLSRLAVLALLLSN
jgi:hypothetical protein